MHFRRTVKAPTRRSAARILGPQVKVCELRGARIRLLESTPTQLPLLDAKVRDRRQSEPETGLMVAAGVVHQMKLDEFTATCPNCRSFRVGHATKKLFACRFAIVVCVNVRTSP